MSVLFLIMLFIVPFSAHAKCDNLVEFLNKAYPNRILTQSYGYSLDRLVIYEKYEKYEKYENGSSISVVECINKNYKTQKKFSFKEKDVAYLEFDEFEGTIIIMFSADPQKTGYLSKQKNEYLFSYGMYER